MLYCKDTCGCRSVTTLHPQYFFASIYEIARPSIMVSSHMEKKQSMPRLKSLKERTLSLWAMNSWGRKAYKKNSARYLKANINFVFCEINATINMLTERFHLDEKILMLSSSVVCLSFIILNTFENKGSIKIVFFFIVPLLISIWWMWILQ